MPGSSASIAVCNTILNVAVAEEISKITKQLENVENIDEEAQKVIIGIIEKHKRILYDGNGYSKEWEEEASKRGLKNIKSSPEALKTFTEEKNIQLFEKYNIYTKKEAISRYQIKIDKYSSWINTEVHAMLSIAKKEILPTCLSYAETIAKSILEQKQINADCSTEEEILSELKENINKLNSRIKMLENMLDKAEKMTDFEEKANYYEGEVIKKMNELRESVDTLELIVPKNKWPMPSYSDIFLED